MLSLGNLEGARQVTAVDLLSFITLLYVSGAGKGQPDRKDWESVYGSPGSWMLLNPGPGQNPSQDFRAIDSFSFKIIT